MIPMADCLFDEYLIEIRKEGLIWPVTVRSRSSA